MSTDFSFKQVTTFHEMHGMHPTNIYNLTCSGYLPPEYINRHVVSNKLDIFSLGVIIIKIMAGPAGYSRSADLSSEEFIDLVRKYVAFVEVN